MKEYQAHELSAAFPGMTKTEFAAFVEDIREEGQRDPIITFQGKILDGMHRYRACLECGRVPIMVELKAGTDPVAFVLSRNLHRRHLTGLQRAAAVVACREWAGAGKPSTRNMDTVSTLQGMAQEAEVSVKTVQRAKMAHVAGLGDAVRAGEVTAKDTAVFVRVPQFWVDQGGDQLLQVCADFGVSLQLVWDTRCVMGINPELGMKIWRGEMETGEAKSLVIRQDLETARMVWSGEREVSLTEFERLRHEAGKQAPWLTEAIASKLAEMTPIQENTGLPAA